MDFYCHNDFYCYRNEDIHISYLSQRHFMLILKHTTVLLLEEYNVRTFTYAVKLDSNKSTGLDDPNAKIRKLANPCLEHAPFAVKH